MKSRQLILFTFTALLVGFAGGYLFAQPLPAGGAGQYRDSPDGTWTAGASTLDEARLFGRGRTFYRLYIEEAGASPRVAREVRIEAQDVPIVDWREEGEIKWISNNTAVTFAHANAHWELELKLKLPPQAGVAE